MQNDRRRFLVGGAAGLTTILVPNVSLARSCCRRRRPCAGVNNTSEFRNCVSFAPVSCYIPDASMIRPSTVESFRVYGTNLYNWYNNGQGGTFTPTVVDTLSGATWGTCTVNGVTQDNGDSWDSYLTFSSSETGSSSGSSGSLTITITLSAYNGCGGATWTWMRQPVTYSS